MINKITITDFSSYLFWDADEKLIDFRENASYVIHRVLEYGEIGDWKLINEYYGLSFIVETAKKFRTLEPRALSFLCVVSHSNREEFRCCTQKQLL